jgi:hypothetical protein
MKTRGYVTVAEMKDALRRLYKEDAETNLEKAFLSAMADDLKPTDESGRWRPSPVLILLSCVLFALFGLFMYFSFGGHA